LGRGWGPGAGARTCHRLVGCERPGQANKPPATAKQAAQLRLRTVL
jgi:hypothetical protein